MKKNFSLYEDLSSDVSNSEIAEQTNIFASIPDYDEIIAFKNNFPCDIPDSDENYNGREELKRFYISKANENIEITHEEKGPLFKTTLIRRKRGRTIISKRNRKEHGSSSRDNIITKIQTHFLKFTINLLNDCVRSEYKNRNKIFKHFNHSNTCKVTSEYVNKLKKSTINDILNEFNISDKYKYCSRDNNKQIVNELSKKNFFLDLFGMNYLKLFNYYYNDNLPLEEIEISKRKIILSKKTESFYYLLQKYKKLEEILLHEVYIFNILILYEH